MDIHGTNRFTLSTDSLVSQLDKCLKSIVFRGGRSFCMEYSQFYPPEQT